MAGRPILLAALVLGAAGLGGCSYGGAGAVIQVTPQDHAKQQHDLEEKTIVWLEKMPASERQTAMDRATKIHQILKDASGTDLKPRVDALGLKI